MRGFLHSKWEGIKRKGLGVKRGRKVLDVPHAMRRYVKARMSGQEREGVLNKKIDVHKVGDHLRYTGCIAGRAGNLLLLPSANLDLCQKEEEHLERNTRTKLREPGLSSEDKMEKKKCTEN